ncbi:MAG: asparagine synthase (glutamine-hydrolyzing) [Geobacter sp.]|nr:asparagine synthase (glutamine-hydrolyzing) [Geobacter sp.]
MCGIAGFIDESSSGYDWCMRLSEMSGKLAHRGPDDGDVWFDPATGVGLAHRRLAIVDLSTSGRQPMSSECGRYVIVFNGEIYNFCHIREQLNKEGFCPQWRGHSDTEVILAAIAAWGLHQAVERFVGMFAFALWDRSERVLYLVRDRIGEKPLYYGWMGGSFIFGSELKSLTVYPAWRGEINHHALARYLQYGYVPGPDSIYRGILKLLPGTILSVGFAGKGTYDESNHPEPKPYWSAREIASRGVFNPFRGTEPEARELLERLLLDAVKQQMVADVPLGAFLSGGVDSSTIVALMQAQSSRPVKTFTIGFNEQGYNEAEHARAVSRHLLTDHTELYVNSVDALAVLPKLPYLYDEPFADSSQIPTFLVCELTRRHVTVSLSGDGGDELFGGYNRYLWGRRIWDAIGWVPQCIRGSAASAITLLSPQTWENIFHKLEPLLSDRLKQRNPGDKLHKLAGVISASTPAMMYQGIVSQWRDVVSLVRDSPSGSSFPTSNGYSWNTPFSDLTQIMMYLDLVTYLPDDILVKVDRAAMGVSLETRVPFLDHRVVEFAWQLPHSMKIRKGDGKWLLRQVLYKYVPRELIERPKTGFSVPLGNWLRGELRDWAEALLDERRMISEGFFNPTLIRQKWLEHLSGRYNWQHNLWGILMFQAWLETTKDT